MIRKWLAVGFILVFLGTSVIPAMGQNIEETASVSRGGWLYVGGTGPGNYSRIQDAIDDASENDTVFVYNGTYFETIQINKPLSLIGENENSTIIWGDGSKDVIHVIEHTHYVNISSFTLRSETLIGALDGIRLGYSNSFIEISFCKIIGQYDGIALQHSSHSIVSHCNITLSDNCGISSTSNSTKIVDCVFSDNSNPSIALSGYNNLIYNCSMSQSANNGGLFLTSASNNTITNNIFFRNQDHGIFLHGTSNNLITDNVFENNSVGIYCSWWKNQLNQIFHNNFIKNDINAIDETMNNSWDNGKEGNYWNDYHGSDSNNDGIGDIPYNISGGSNKDSYPLIYPWYSTHPNTVFIDDDFDENTTGWGFDKFNRIQYGINEVPENGIVYVYNGIYYENLHIAKSINLLGENKEFTIIDGSGGKDVINIEADKVTITGFTIQNNNWTNYGAIAVRFSDSARIFKNIIKSNKCGVYLYWSNSNYVSNNTIYNNLNYGFSLINSHDNDISKNYLINNSISIQFAESNRNIISNNIIFNNSGGVELWLSYNNKFLKNTFMNNYWDAVFQSSGNKIFFHRNIWRNNYWNRLRYFPKPIFGMLMWGEDLQIRIPWLQFDWHPAQEPYDIEVR